MSATDEKCVYWHRELPPADAEIAGEHTIEASSSRVAGTMNHRDELWNHCYETLMATTHLRIVQEISRLGGDYARVFEESICTRRDDATGEVWLQGRFSYMLYRRSTRAA